MRVHPSLSPSEAIKRRPPPPSPCTTSLISRRINARTPHLASFCGRVSHRETLEREPESRQHEAYGGEEGKRDLDPGWPDFSFPLSSRLSGHFLRPRAWARATTHKVARSSRKAGPADSRRSEGRGMAPVLCFPWHKRTKYDTLGPGQRGVFLCVSPIPMAGP